MLIARSSSVPPRSMRSASVSLADARVAAQRRRVSRPRRRRPGRRRRSGGPRPAAARRPRRPGGGSEVEVRRDAADRDRPAEDLADALLEDRPAPLGDVLEERLALREAEGHDVAVDRDRAADRMSGLIGGGLAQLGDDAGPGAVSSAAAASVADAGGGTSGSAARAGPGALRPAPRPRRAADGVPAGSASAAGAAARRRASRAPPGRGAAAGRRHGSARASAAGGVGSAAAARPATAGRGRRPRGLGPAPRLARSARPAAGGDGAAAAPSSASSSWKRRPPRPCAARVDRREPAGGGGERAAVGSPAGRRSVERGRRAPRAGRRRPGRGTRARSRPRSSSSSRTASPASASPADERVDERVDRSRRRRGRAGRATRVGGQRDRRPTTSSWSSIDSASRMPPAARRAMSAIASGVGRRGPRPRGSSPSLPSIWATVSGRKSNRWTRDRTAGRICAGVGRAEDEHDVVGRLLERLEEDVPALLDPLDLVDDEDLAPEVGRGRRRRRGEQLAHVVDLVVRRRVQLDDVERAALADRDAGGAARRTARRPEVRAVERLGDDPGHRRLARPARADEQQRVGDLVRSGRRCGASRRPASWPTISAERLGAPAAVEGLVRTGRRGSDASGAQLRVHATLGSGSKGRSPCTLRRSDAPAPTVASGSDQAVPRHPAKIA